MDRPPLLPSPLGNDLISQCRVWNTLSYPHETHDTPKNRNLEKQYESKLGRAIQESQAIITSQHAMLREVPARLVIYSF